jgi:hypothetical protein
VISRDERPGYDTCLILRAKSPITYKNGTPKTAVLPENPNLLPCLTFSSVPLTLEQRIASLDDPLQEVCDAATRRLCPRRLHRHPVPVSHGTAPGKLRMTTSIGRLQADGASPTPPSDGSALLGLAVTPVAWLAKCSRVRPAPYRAHLAAAAISRSLAASQPARHAWSARYGQGGA